MSGRSRHSNIDGCIVASQSCGMYQCMLCHHYVWQLYSSLPGFRPVISDFQGTTFPSVAPCVVVIIVAWCVPPSWHVFNDSSIAGVATTIRYSSPLFTCIFIFGLWHFHSLLLPIQPHIHPFILISVCSLIPIFDWVSAQSICRYFHSSLYSIIHDFKPLVASCWCIPHFIHYCIVWSSG